MTNKEAIELLKKMPIVHAGYKEVIDIAIEALNCSEMPNNSDCISRQMAIDALAKFVPYAICDASTESYTNGLTDAYNLICQLPSAQPEPCEDAVSRQRLLSDLKELTAAWGKYPVMEEQIKGVETAIGYVETIPSAQPEIIRCKDCKFYSPMNRETKTGICNLTIHQNFGDNWFCAGAERKTDGDGRKEGTG